ncbi:MAG: zinc finger-like domain-containing protein [Patescibacteria group bacterium]|nr:zinc finger-like domain-containing protein [Patescibacteria group bacterium]
MTATAELERTTLTREIAGLGTILFEESPSWRAYWWLPEGNCLACDGNGREAGARPNTTRKCKACDGAGTPKRQRMTSVTTLLNVIVPKDLSWWGEARGIEGALAALRMGEINSDTPADRAVEVVRTLGLGAEAARDMRATSGVSIHSLLEAYMRTGDIPSVGDHRPEDQGYVRGLCRFILEHDPQPLPNGAGIEELVCDPVAGYAGRRDLRCLIRERRIAIDAKTQERGNVYGGAHLQLGLYERAGQLCGDEPSDEMWVLPLAADGSLPEPMPVKFDLSVLEAALTYWQVFKPIDDACAARNKARREAQA